jgi:hypothetical protein
MDNINLPNVNDEDLKNIGEAFMWIGRVELLLGVIISSKSGLDKVEKKIRDKLLKGKSLESKTNLAKDLINRGLIKRLEDLSNERAILAHGAFMPMMHNKAITGFGFLKNGKVTKPNYENIINNARELFNDLSKELNE